MDWPTTYHLHPTRANLLRPFSQLLKARVLEIGAGCGALTRYIGECGGQLLALEGSPRRASIAAARTRDLANVVVVAEDFNTFDVGSEKFDVFTLVAVMLAVIIFYFKKFFLLYKDLGNMAVNTKDSIKNLLHQFELNKQYYFSYYLAFAPALVCQMILMNEFKILATPLQNEPEIVRELTMSLIFIMGIAVGLFALYGIAKWWFQYFYGKYIDDVVLIDTQINGGNVDEVTKIEKRRKSRYSRSERFFVARMGKAGSYVNALLWLSFYTIIGFVIIVICSVALGYMAAHFSH